MINYTKLNNRRIRFFIGFGYFLIVCNATILIKFSRVAFHFRRRMENYDKKFTLSEDAFENFGLQSRQLLCDAAINAKQFMFGYDLSHQEERQKITSLTNWNSMGVLRRCMTWNHQRIRGRLRKDWDPKCLQYQFHSTRLGTSKRWQIKSIQCVNEKLIKWFVAFGLVGKCMYLLEPGAEKAIFGLRITGIFDPMAIVDNRPVHYFYDLFRASKDTLESIVCKISHEDRLRLCSAILVLLSPKDSLPNRNYLVKDRKPCVKKDVKIENDILNARFLRCTIIRNKRLLTPFHVLGEANERGAVFVFAVGESRELELYARVIKVASLINPDDQTSKILLPDLWGQKAQRSLRVP